MSKSISTITFLVGLGLIVLGIFGGGVEVKEVKIPTLPTVSRMLSVAAGSALLTLCIVSPGLFVPPGHPNQPGEHVNIPAPTPPVPTADKRAPGAAIRNGLTTVREVKLALQSLGGYSGPIDDETNDAYFQSVADFQVSQNIEADGMVGGETFPKLRNAAPMFFRKASHAAPKAVEADAGPASGKP